MTTNAIEVSNALQLGDSQFAADFEAPASPELLLRISLTELAELNDALDGWGAERNNLRALLVERAREAAPEMVAAAETAAAATDDAEAAADARALADELTEDEPQAPPVVLDPGVSKARRRLARKHVCCRLPAGAPLWEAVWEAWGRSSGEVLDLELEKAVAKHNRVANPEHKLTEENVRTHMHYHQPEQPPTSVRVQHEAKRVAQGIRPRDRRVLELVAQLDKVGIRSFAAHFGCREDSAGNTLRRLKHRRLLRCIRIPRVPGETGGRIAYYLTSLGRAVNELLHDGGSGLKVTAVNRADGVGRLALPHDLMAAEVLSTLVRDAAARPYRVRKGGGARLELSSLPANALASGQLYLGHVVPGFWEGRVKGGDKRENVIPDGFLVLGVRDDDGLDVGLGLLAEFDAGSVWKQLAGREQLFSYVSLARAPGTPVAQRFPDFAVPGYQVPVLFITQDGTVRGTRGETELEASPAELNRKRAEDIMRAFFARREGFRWEADPTAVRPSLPPIYMCVHAELRAQGWDTKVWVLNRAVTETPDGTPRLPVVPDDVPRLPLWRAMLSDAQPVLDRLMLGARDVVRVDLKGAPPYYGVESRASGVADRQERERNAEKLESEFDEMSAGYQESPAQSEVPRGGVA